MATSEKQVELAHNVLSELAKGLADVVQELDQLTVQPPADDVEAQTESSESNDANIDRSLRDVWKQFASEKGKMEEAATNILRLCTLLESLRGSKTDEITPPEASVSQQDAASPQVQEKHHTAETVQSVFSIAPGPATTTSVIQPDGSSKAYEYSALEPGDFRVLSLLPGDTDSPVKCQLTQYSLDDKPEYHAISYTWGTEEQNHGIDIDGCTFLITPNVDSALRVFRSRGIRDVWIDSICINQRDIEERNNQIKLMGKIYSQSIQLLVWLGVEDEYTAIAIDFISKFDLVHTKSEQNMLWGELSNNFEAARKTLQAVSHFLSRPWFSRAWVLQEFILSHETPSFFFSGKFCVSLKAMEVIREQFGRNILAATLVGKRSDEHQEIVMESLKGALQYTKLYHGRLHFGFVETLLGSQDESEDVNKVMVSSCLSYWLELIRGSLSTDPRDMVFSVLGIVESLVLQGVMPGYSRRELKVDYGVSVEDVYSSVVKAIATETRSLDILGSCSPDRALVNRTWTPDWTVPRNERNGFGDGIFTKGIFSASGKVPCEVDFAKDLSTMTAKGLEWDVVTASAQPGENPLDIFDVAIRFLGMEPRKNLSDQELEDWAEYKTSRLREILGMRIDRDRSLADFKARQKAIMDSLAGVGLADLIEPYLKDGYILVLTSKGYLGQAVERKGGIHEGDVVCVLFGCSLPMVLRPVENHYEVVGDIYITEIMYGEAIKSMEAGDTEVKEFELR